MAASPDSVTLELCPRRRIDVIDVNARLRDEVGDFLAPFERALYCSYHTTAGYLARGVGERLARHGTVHDFLAPFQELFPPEAPYRHDQMHLRTELTPEQRRNEPRNADSHLTFIGSGLENCVTYASDPERPVYFVDLDGINQDDAADRRTRRTTVLGYNREVSIERLTLDVPVSAHPIDSISLRDPRLGLFDRLHELLAERGIHNGRIDLRLAPDERHAGLTVNEYETLLMKHDLAEVLRDPVRFMARKGRNMLRDPGAIPAKAKNYAKYDLVCLVNTCLDTLGLSESFVERVIDKCLGVPAERFLGMKRSVSLLVAEDPTNGEGTIVQGRYQSPILVQWRKAAPGARRIEATLTRFEG